MKLHTFLVGSVIGLLCLGSCAKTVPNKDYTQYVDPFIGTGGHGHTFPGAVVPYSMIQPSPDTRIDGWDACSGYHYSDSTINGFSHTHLSGTGCCDLGDVLLMPTVGKQSYAAVNTQQMAYASSFSHANEEASPGYYAVFLDRYKVKAELTATKRVAMHRYTFPASTSAGFILDLDYSLAHQENSEMEIKVLSNTEICGFKKTKYWAFDQQIAFYAVFSKPFTYDLIEDSTATQLDGTKAPSCKILLHFNTTEKEQVLVKVGVSAVDPAGAKKNVQKEMPGWNFQAVKMAAKNAWKKHLSVIAIQSDNLQQLRTFYTALYHVGISPNLLTDIDGRYLGMDLKIHQGDVKAPLYSTFSLWDTFRAFHPLLTIINPTLNNQFIRSLILKDQEGGILPMWDLASNYTGTMIGYHAVSVIVDAYVKGYQNFDVESAFKASLRTAEYNLEGIKCPALVLPHLMPEAKRYKNKLGYIPCDRVNESVAKALAYAYDDWCISIFADSLGEMAIGNKYSRFSKAYEFYFDESVRFMRGLDSKGKWRTPFNPSSSNHRNDDYCEGTAWQWTWFVPHDIEGLVNLMGGEAPFAEKLDSLFTASSKLEGAVVSSDISGLIGQYAHGNEPSHHIIHLYNYVNQPSKTQALIDSVLVSQYTDQPDGLSGNEDCGQMSAWYVLNAMGFYQVCPGKPVYSIGRPLHKQAKIHLPNGRTFTIKAINNSETNKYIQSVQLNGKAIVTPFFTHHDLERGGVLEITMTNHPTSWGIKKN